MRWTLVWLLGLAMLAAQERPAGVVAGTVVDEVTGAPVRRAVVELSCAEECLARPSIAVETQADGVFRFDGLAAGTYSVAARRSGYPVQFQLGRLSGFVLGAARQRTGITLKLAPQGVISGRVLDEESEALQGATVQILRRSGLGEMPGWRPGGDTIRTNDRGEYRFANLVAGEYTLVASYPAPAVSWTGGGKVRPGVYRSSYYGGGRELGEARGIIVAAGRETAGIDLRLRKEASYRVRVRVQGGQVERVYVGVVTRDFRESAGSAAVAPDAGVFEITGVGAGRWYVHASGYTSGDQRLSGETAIELSTQDLDDVVVQLGAVRKLAGVFAYDGPAGSGPAWRGLKVALVPQGALRAGPATYEGSENGAFSVRYEVPGSYVIEPQGDLPAGVYLASIRSGSEEYYGRELDLGGAPPETLQILYRFGAAQVSGVLEGPLGDSAEERGAVVLLPAEEQLWRRPYMQTTVVQADGRFAFEGVRPGEYLVCHMPGGELRRAPLAAAVRLKAEPGGAHDVRVKAQRAGRD